MSNIMKELENILKARYGKDVRQAIHNAIHQCYEDGKAGSMDLIARESIESLQDDVSKLNADAISLDSRVKTIDSRVDLLDIKKTTDSALNNTKHGGLRLTKMQGNTEQKKLSGKNLLDCSECDATGNASVFTSINANSFTISGIWFAMFNVDVEPNTDYTLTYKAKHSSVTAYSGQVSIYDSVGSIAYSRNGNVTFNSGDNESLRFYFYCGDGTNGDTVTYSDIQLELGTVATPFEPFIGGVELIQGGYSWSTGAPTGGTTLIGSKNAISCNSGDVIKLNCDNATTVGVIYYNKGTYVSYDYNTSGGDLEKTVPSGVTEFKFNVINSNGITPETAGKVSLTVNGKPIYIRATPVEMVSGAWLNTGISYNYANYICNKNPIPCKKGDVIKLTAEKSFNNAGGIAVYNESGHLYSKSSGNGTEVEYTVHVDATYFGFNVIKDIGKITLTINGVSVAVGEQPVMTSPSPYYEQPLYHTSDVVEMIQGGFANGAYTNSTVSVCNKNKIPCKSGDIVKVLTEKAYNIAIFMFDKDGKALSYNSLSNVKSNEMTTPINATHWAYHIQHADGLTPSTVGKITLTINGKYVNCIKGHGKNFLNTVLSSQTINGGTVTVNEDKSITLNGTFSATSLILLGTVETEIGERYTLSGGISAGVRLEFRTSTNVLYDNIDNGSGATNEAKDTSVNVFIRVSGSTTLNNRTVYPMVRKADILDDTYEPYQETVAYFLTDSPFRADEFLFIENGLFKKTNCWVEKVLDGSEDWNLYFSTEGYFSTRHFSPTIADYTTVNVLSDGYAGITRNEMRALKVNQYAISYGNTELAVRDLSCKTADEFKAKLQANPIPFMFKRATPTIEVLDTESQLALHSLETFDGVTYIEVDSRVKPLGIECEYGTSQVGAYTLQAMNVAESNAIKIEDAITTMLMIGA